MHCKASCLLSQANNHTRKLVKNNLTDNQSKDKYRLLEVMDYTNSKYANNLEDRKLITKYYFFICKVIVI